MFYYLQSHPKIWLPVIKEPHFFSEVAPGEQLPVCKDQQDYDALFAKCPKGQFAVDASTTYLQSPAAAKKIHAYNPAAKIIIMLRNPVDFMFSFHRERMVNHAVEADFNEVILHPQRYDKHADYLKLVTSWPNDIERYMQIFGRDKVHIILLEEMAASPVQVFDDTLRFLGLEPGPSYPEFRTHNPAKRPRSKWMGKAIRTPWLAASVKSWLAKYPALYRHIQALLWPKTDYHRTVSNEMRDMLMQKTTPTITALERVTGKNFSLWCTHTKK